MLRNDRKKSTAEEKKSLLADTDEPGGTAQPETMYDDFVNYQPETSKKEQADLVFLDEDQKESNFSHRKKDGIHGANALVFSDIVQASHYVGLKNEEKVSKVVDDFNQGNAESFVKEISQASSTFGFSGRRIGRDEFWLLRRGGKLQLVPFSQQLVRTKKYPVDVSVDDLGVHKQNELMIGANGRFVINVPPGKLLKAWEDNNTPIFLGEGTHFIKNPNFRLETPNNAAANLVSIAELYIRHGNYHVVRVPQGKLLKIWINNEAHLLEPQAQPYVFNDPTFRLDTADPNASLVNISELYIRHNNRHIVRVPQGKLLKIWINNEARLLEPQVAPYTFNDPTFRLDAIDIQASLVSILDPYI